LSRHYYANIINKQFTIKKVLDVLYIALMLGMTWLLLTPNNVTISYTQNMLMQNDSAIEKEKA
jgi:hypothetical protein